MLYLIARSARRCAVLGRGPTALFDAALRGHPPIFDGDEAEVREYHEENLAHCDGVLIFYGAGNELWLRRKLREIQKSAGLRPHEAAAAASAICLDRRRRTPEKERFRTHDATRRAAVGRAVVGSSRLQPVHRAG